MPFRFALQSILHYRHSLEHQQELKLRAANQQVARVRHLIEQLDLHRNELYKARDGQLGAGLSGAQLRFDWECDRDLLRHRRELEQQLLRLQQSRDQQREIFRQARQAREMLEGVREEQLRQYTESAGRREQRNLDDLFLLRRRKPSRG